MSVYTNYVSENIVKFGFHTVRYDCVFLTDGVRVTCILTNYTEPKEKRREESFFASNMVDAIEEVSNIVAVKYLEVDPLLGNEEQKLLYEEDETDSTGIISVFPRLSIYVCIFSKQSLEKS